MCLSRDTKDDRKVDNARNGIVPFQSSNFSWGNLYSFYVKTPGKGINPLFPELCPIVWQ